MPSVLIVDSDVDHASRLTSVLRETGFETALAQDLSAAHKILLRKMPEIAIVDETVDGKPSLDLLDELNLSNVVEIYLMSDDPSLQTASRAMRVGVSDYFGKPVDAERLRRNLVEIKSDLECAATRRVARKTGRGLMVGESPPMQRLYRMIRKVAPTDASVLIIGESGVGKELVATTIHELSERSHCELVAVNCSAIPKDLIESELFGHRKGSFTGATSSHRGYFEIAQGGTLFLDEITEMHPGMQAKLLRVLESHRVRPLGSEKDIEVNVRIVAATNREPGDAIRENRLREDLYYRLTQFPIRVPPLTERGEDLVLLANHFLRVQNRETGLNRTLGKEALDALRQHDWPGNVRELKNAIVHAHLLAGGTIGVDDLPDAIPSEARSRVESLRVSVGAPVAEVERRHILATLAHFEGDKKRAAEALGISLKTLYNRLKDYGVHKPG